MEGISKSEKSRSEGATLTPYALHIIFSAIVLCVVTYALPSFAGQLSKDDKARVDSMFPKAFEQLYSTREVVYNKQEIRSVEHGICPIAEFTSP